MKLEPYSVYLYFREGTILEQAVKPDPLLRLGILLRCVLLVLLLFALACSILLPGSHLSSYERMHEHPLLQGILGHRLSILHHLPLVYQPDILPVLPYLLAKHAVLQLTHGFRRVFLDRHPHDLLVIRFLHLDSEMHPRQV